MAPVLALWFRRSIVGLESPCVVEDHPREGGEAYTKAVNPKMMNNMVMVAIDLIALLLFIQTPALNPVINVFIREAWFNCGAINMQRIEIARKGA